jgi:hypothetical protein
MADNWNVEVLKAIAMSFIFEFNSAFLRIVSVFVH